MTLREFTNKYAPLPAASPRPLWRKVFPTNLRWEEVQIKAGYIRRFGPFYLEHVSPVYDKVLKEEWERIHLGEVIDTEWRSVFVY